LILAGLALIAITAGAWAVLIFPGNQTLEGPAAFSVYLGPKIRLDDLTFDIKYENGGGVDIHFSASTYSPPKKGASGNMGSITLYTPGRFQTNCPAGVRCYEATAGPAFPLATWIIFPLNLNNGQLTQYTVQLHGPQFAFAANATAATVQLPYVVQYPNTSATTVITMYYEIPGVRSYDWSTPPYLTYNDWGLWVQDLSPSSPENQPGAEITGTNRDRQAQDNRDTFISGVLLGVAGGAIVAVVQEGLHMLFDERRREKAYSAEPGS
jgi:hypothetical protein